MKRDKQVNLRDMALACLARREHSRYELEKKLGKHADSAAELASLLDDFEKRGWLSQQRVVEQVLQSRRRRYGAQRIVQELHDKGISEDLIDNANVALRQTEFEAAYQVWQKKFSGPPKDAKERAKQFRFLRGRGFGVELILKIIDQRNSE